MLGNRLIDYHIFPTNLNGNLFLDFLVNYLFKILKDLSLDKRRSLYARRSVTTNRRLRRWLNEHFFFFNRWIDRGDSFGLGPFEITLNKKCISLKLILLKGYGIELNIFAMD